MMSGGLKKIGLLMLAAVLLVGSSFIQRSLNNDRRELGLTRLEPLENAPPLLAFTTVALGGFRGLIANMLWFRASDLQDQDKFFEATQLADWITKLEPHFVQVWVHQAWNLAYNISVKFKDYPDRWRWVQRGIELLRDEGLKYNPNATLIYRELAWFFQHKIGAHIDDASMYYKQQLADEMAVVFDKKTPDLDELIDPKTDDARRRSALLKEKYKMDPAFMKNVDERFGPLEWRLPEAHAIYWAAMGLKRAEENPDKVNQEDLITLRRVIYQCMLVSFHRGRLEENPFEQAFEFGPNLNIVSNVNDSYLEMMAEDEANREHIGRAHRNFVRDAVYFLYVNNRMSEAATWFEYLKSEYPNKTILEDYTNSYPANVTLDQYAVIRVREESQGFSRDRITTVIQGLIANSYRSLLMNEDDRAFGYQLLARKLWQSYQSQVPEDRMDPLGLESIESMKWVILNRLLDPERGIAPEMQAALRTKLGLPAGWRPANSPPVTAPQTPP